MGDGARLDEALPLHNGVQSWQAFCSVLQRPSHPAFSGSSERGEIKGEGGGGGCGGGHGGRAGGGGGSLGGRRLSGEPARGLIISVMML